MVGDFLMANRLLSILRTKQSYIFVSVALWQLFVMPIAFADTAGAISQGFTTNTTNITQGSLVSLVSSNSNIVVPANSASNVANLVGIAADKPLVELSGNSTSSL